jgi:hypothetical protein
VETIDPDALVGAVKFTKRTIAAALQECSALLPAVWNESPAMLFLAASPQTKRVRQSLTACPAAAGRV